MAPKYEFPMSNYGQNTKIYLYRKFNPSKITTNLSEDYNHGFSTCFQGKNKFQIRQSSFISISDNLLTFIVVKINIFQLPKSFKYINNMKNELLA